MKIIYDSNGFIWQASLDNNMPVPDGFTGSIVPEYTFSGGLTYMLCNMPRYKYVEDEIVEITDYHDYHIDPSIWKIRISAMDKAADEDTSYLEGYIDIVDDYEELTALASPSAYDLAYVLEEESIYEYDAVNEKWFIPYQLLGQHVKGCKLIYVDGTSIKVNDGIIDIKNHEYYHHDELILTWSDVLDGATKKANTWYYVYVRPNGTNEFTAFISETEPTVDYRGLTVSMRAQSSKYHPTRSARFVGTFKTDSNQDIIPFKRIINKIIYANGHNHVLAEGEAITKTAVDCSSFIPPTSDISIIYYESNYGVEDKHVGSNDTWFIDFSVGSGTVEIPMSSSSIYYKNDTEGDSMSLGVFGYYEYL